MQTWELLEEVKTMILSCKEGLGMLEMATSPAELLSVTHLWRPV